MNLTMSPADRRRFEHAMTTLLSPGDHANADAWRRAALSSVQSLLGADHSFGMIELPTHDTVYTEESGIATGIAAYGEYFHTVDQGVTERRKRLGRSVYTRAMVYDESHLDDYEIYVDWCVPYRLFDPLVMTADDVAARDFPIPATFAFYHERESASRFGDRGIALLELLMPAFRAGAATAVRLASYITALAGVVDQLDTAIALFSPTGQCTHRNPALERLLLRDLDRRHIIDSASRLARVVGCVTSPSLALGAAAQLAQSGSQLRTATGRYRLRPSRLNTGVAWQAPTVMVVIERVGRTSLNDATLVTQYRLTPREVEVARLLATGMDSAALADALAISRHTARRHTERVLAKLNLHRRAQVAAFLNGT